MQGAAVPAGFQWPRPQGPAAHLRSPGQLAPPVLARVSDDVNPPSPNTSNPWQLQKVSGAQVACPSQHVSVPVTGEQGRYRSEAFALCLSLSHGHYCHNELDTPDLGAVPLLPFVWSTHDASSSRCGATWRGGHRPHSSKPARQVGAWRAMLPEQPSGICGVS